MNRTLVCFCEEEFEQDIPEVFDAGEKPSLYQDVLNGSLMAVPCPTCGKVLKPEFPFQLKDDGKGVDIFFIPELDRGAYLLSRLDYKPGKHKRIVIGYRELVEKVKILQAGLDDRVVEMLKYYLLQKAVQSVESDEVSLEIFFHEKKPGGLTFHIEGLKADEVAVFDIKQDMYDKVAQSIDSESGKEPFDTFLTPPYVSVNKVYFEP